ncbi:MAG: CBS domain-containing protein [Candidatus Aenigmarchaeota archaeon]|nr:CBS domain-containing protein [Candidatus Aenigmarchaeota archaeon]
MKVQEVMNPKVLCIKEDETISQAVERMVKNRYHQLPVVNEKIEGMIFLKDIIKVKSDLTKTGVKNIVRSVPYLEKNQDVEKAIKILIESGVRALPVVENEKIVGILSEVDILEKYFEEKSIRVKDVMNKPIVLEENSSLRKAIRIMEKNNISSLPIINWEEKLVGCINIFSFAELIAKERSRIQSFKSAKEKIDFFDNPVKNFIFQPKTCEKETPISEVKDLFRKYEEIVVVENERPIGIVKPRDILSVWRTVELTELVCIGAKKEEVESVLGRSLEKWKRMGIEKVVLMIEQIGVRKKFEGKMKVVGKNINLMVSAVEYDKIFLIRNLKEVLERKIVEERNKSMALRRRVEKP